MHPFILIAEDDEDSAKLIDLALKEINTDINWRFFSNARDSLNYIKTEEAKPSLVVIAFSKAPNQGLQMLREIKENKRLDDIPVVVYTTSFDPIDIDLANDLKCDGYYINEFDFEDMRTALNDMLSYIAIHEVH